MKPVLLSCTLLFLFASCSKQKDLPANPGQVTTNASVKSDKPETCTFGLTKFNLTKRAPVQLDGKRPPSGGGGTGGGGTTPAPGSSVILLDFDGHYVSGTAWNYNGNFTCAPANLSADDMTEIFDRVTNDYSPFNVTVTTSESVYSAAPVNKRTRVIITESYEWYGNAGGTSYVGSFTWGDNTPCFVFSSMLYYDVKKISEATAHEAAHTIGLLHQSLYDANCNRITTYNPGEGSGENGWAPIMGVGYYQNVTLWHNGPTVSGCTAYADEIAMISNTVGGFKADDHANSTSAASTLSSSAQGLINNSSDMDFFYLNTTAQKTISALPYAIGANNAGANVNLVLKVYNSNGNLISTIDDAETLGASVVLAPGSYYLSVSTVANQYASTYGMIGKYSITAN